MSAREWAAASYHRVSQPLETIGRSVLDRLELAGDETVLDAGCGSGRVTAALRERLPRGRVIGVDGSAAMVEEARRTLGPGVELFQADLAQLELAEPVDVVFSTATFHWIADHDALFARLFAALRPGGRLFAQCGGEGNVANVLPAIAAASARDPFAPHLAGWPGPWRFAGPEETARKLTAAGFTAVETGLERREVRPEDKREFLATVVLGSHLERLPTELRGPFAEAVAERLPEPLVMEYVRLNLAARRPE